MTRVVLGFIAVQVALALLACGRASASEASPKSASAANGRGASAPSRQAAEPSRGRSVPIATTPGAFRIPIENLDGALIFDSTLRGGAQRDTSGTLLLDTGAGYLALDAGLVRAMGLADSEVSVMSFASRPLARLRAGQLQQDAVGPVLAIDTRVIRQATDREVLGLLGQAPLASFAVQIDYRSDTLALVPMRRDGLMATRPKRAIATDMAAGSAATAMAIRASREQLDGALSSSAVAVPFELEGDGKIVLNGRISERSAAAGGEPLHLILDTGATKTVLFEHAFRALPRSTPWRELRGLSAPTFYGSEDTYLARVPRISLGEHDAAIAADEVDVAVMQGDLEAALSQAVQRRVDGLLGYSFLRRFRVTIDYPHHVLWLERVPVGEDQRPYEYSHVGVQIERRDGRLEVVAVAEGSPAEDAGIQAGDEFVSLGGRTVERMDLLEVARALEGPPGSRVRFRLVRGGVVKDYLLKRRRLL